MTLTEEELGVPVAIEGEDGGLVINPEANPDEDDGWFEMLEDEDDTAEH